jgi:hypothetical protein
MLGRWAGAGSLLRLAEVEEVNAFPRAAEIVPESETGGVNFKRLEFCLKPGEQGTGLLGFYLVLNDDVRPEGLAVLRDEVVGELGGELGVKALQCGRGEGVGDASAQGADAGDADGEGFAVGCGCESVGDLLGGRELVEERDVGGDLVEVGWIVLLAQGFKVRVGGGVEFEGEDGGHGFIPKLRKSKR